MSAHSTQRSRWAMFVTTVVFLTACSAGMDNVRRDGSGSCAFGVQLDGRSYYANGGIKIMPTYDEPLGSAIVPPCESEEGFQIEAFSIVGVDPKVAFASPEREEIIFIAEGVYEMPPELQRLRRPPPCAGNAPVELAGQWLGILDPGVDLVPPYRLQMRVDLASVPRYERTFVAIRVEPGLGRPLGRADLRSSLWKGGSLTVMVSCSGGRFLAKTITALPGT
jgi:hypothetical protein